MYHQVSRSNFLSGVFQMKAFMNIRILSALVFIGPLTGCTADWDGSDGWGEPIGQLQQPVPKSVCADGMTTPGIDVSYYQGQVDWQK